MVQQQTWLQLVAALELCIEVVIIQTVVESDNDLRVMATK